MEYYGIDGTVKHAVYRHVLPKQVIIESPSRFAKYDNSFSKDINVLFVENLNLTYYAQYVNGTLKVQC